MVQERGNVIFLNLENNSSYRVHKHIIVLQGEIICTSSPSLCHLTSVGIVLLLISRLIASIVVPINYIHL